MNEPIFHDHPEGLVPEEECNWFCSYCDTKNPPHRLRCSKCGKLTCEERCDNCREWKPIDDLETIGTCKITGNEKPRHNHCVLWKAKKK